MQKTAESALQIVKETKVVAEEFNKVQYHCEKPKSRRVI